MTRLARLIREQKIWFILMSVALLLFVYGELTGTRLFNSATVEEWSPGRVGAYNSIHHK